MPPAAIAGRHLLAAGLATLALAPAAGASVGEVVPRPCAPDEAPCSGGEVLVVRGEGSERNALTLRRAGGDVVVDDTGAPIHPGQGCAATTPQELVCALPDTRFANGPPVYHVEVYAGDGDDAVVLKAGDGRFFDALLDGGPGADRLDASHGGDGHADLRGGGGRDTLLGGRGDDRLADGDGDAGADADVLDGGPGVDTLDYSDRRRAVSVDLAAGTGGARGEGDTVRHVENVTGGGGRDRLLGDDGPNELFAGDGPNVVVSGRGGNDTIGVGTGATVRAGGGDDTIVTGSADNVRCGAGADLILLGKPTGAAPDVFGADCEAAHSTFGIAQRLHARPRHASDAVLDLSLTCFPVEQACHVAIELVAHTGGPVVVGQGRVANRPGTSARHVRVRLNRRGWRVLRRRRHLLVDVRERWTGVDGSGHGVAYRLWLERR